MSDPFPGLSFPAPGGGYASVDDLLLVSDRVEVDLTITRWKKNGASLRIRVKALSFDQQERIDRGSLVKIDGQIVKSETRFACLTLREAVIVPQMNADQARAMGEHNPSIVGVIVRFVWEVLSALDQETIDAIVEQAIPDSQQSAPDAPPHDDSRDEQADDFTPESTYAIDHERDPELAEA